jgi:heme oxygenase (mycobilin-producing)
MTVIKINAITVPAESGEEVARRFAARAGSVDGHDGFEGFELLKPTDDRTTWLVVTRWRDQASFDAWVASPAFAHGHQGGPGSAGGGGRPEGGAGGGRPEGATGGHPGADRGGQGGPPMGLTAELWSYEPIVGSSGTA